MKIPFSWLKEYVETDLSAGELQEKLFSCGFEVEELIYLGKDVQNVVVGRIERCEKHPDADRLSVCAVDCGAFGKKQIVTAATNVFAGALVPVALDGATVLSAEGVQKIKTGKLRGVVSEGMFCSGEELGIGDDFYEGAGVNGILLLSEEDARAGDDIRPVVGIDDYIFDIAVTANRPDCMSVYGIAREVAAVLKKPLLPLDCSYTAEPSDVRISVEVKEPKLCPLYVGSYVKDVKIEKSPRLIRRRLALMGLRSVNSVVDITNYVLLEVGQPMHAFDRKFLHGDKIVVRRAEAGEKIVTLDEKEFTLTPDALLICDAERPVALAGIMGGLNSEIKSDTGEVFLEAACFARDSVRKTSRALGQRSDSSARFEKGVYEIFPHLGMARALCLMQKLGCGVPTEVVCVAGRSLSALPRRKIAASYEKLDGVLGIHVPEEAADDILKRLGFTVRRRGAAFTAEVPLWREDIEGYPDLAEEVIRMYGYEHITPTFLKTAAVTRGGLTPAQKQELKFKETLIGRGFFEACNYSFYSPKDFDLLRLPADAPERHAIKILNPISEELSVMRTLLTPSLVADVVRNVRRGNESGKLFELANVYLADELPLVSLPTERKKAALALWGEGDFFDLKGAVETVAEAFGIKLAFARAELPFLHPGVCAKVTMGEKEVGFIGELHPAIAADLALEKRAYFAELDYDAMSRKFRKDVKYGGMPKFPDVERDLAVVVKEETTCAEVEACILRASKAVKRAELFDVYRDLRIGAGKKSMAFRLTFAGGEKQVTPEYADKIFATVVAALSREMGGTLR